MKKSCVLTKDKNKFLIYKSQDDDSEDMTHGHILATEKEYPTCIIENTMAINLTEDKYNVLSIYF